MSNICILECVANDNCSDAHVRQAKIIKRHLEKHGHFCTILYIDTMHKYINEKFDVIIKSYSTFYENYEDEIKICVNNRNNARFFFITNEYTIQSSNVLNKTRKAGCKWNIIANFDIKTITNKMWHNKFFINLNCLFYEPKEQQTKKYKVCYYGTYRKNRKKYFQKYFVSEKFVLSTSPKSVKKFQKDGCKFLPCKRFIWGNKKDTLGLFEYSLYIEDEWIHSNFHNLADRFYEAMSNNVVTVFDKSCINTLNKSELKNLDFSQFMIDGYEEIKKRNYLADWNVQSEWREMLMQNKTETLEKIEKILIEG